MPEKSLRNVQSEAANKLGISVMQGVNVLPLCGKTGQTILEILQDNGFSEPESPCGGRGTCGKCLVRVSAAGKEEAEVLACRTAAEDGMLVRIPETQGEIRVLKGSGALESAGNRSADEESRAAGITETGAAAWKVYPETELAAAVDIGTTTVVMSLLDPASGKTIAETGERNRQSIYGADVIARISAAMQGKREALAGLIREQIDRMIRTLCAEQGVNPEQIRTASIAGNTTMLHLFAGLDPEGIGKAPFTPVSLFGADYSCAPDTPETENAGRGNRYLKTIPQAELYLCPAVSGYVGGDITAGVTALGMDLSDELSLLIDVGTNGEMVLGTKAGFVCCAAAAGPVFEGAEIRFGMQASEGAIDAVRAEKDHLLVHVIEAENPSEAGPAQARGICGSGLLDAVSAMLALGAVDETGRMWDPEEDDEEDIPEAALPYLCTINEEPAFRITERVSIFQSDVRKVQLGKAAIAAGIRALLKEAGVSPAEIKHLYLAGGFGSRLNPESAAAIGLIPEALLPVTQAAGNTALAGAKRVLIDQTAKERLEVLRSAMHYVELSGHPTFNEAYIEEMMFPE